MCLLRGTNWIFIYDPTFCPHSVFMCFVWMWEQTAIISLCSINCLVFITEPECVYCAVRTESLCIILRSPHTVYLCVLCGSEKKAAIISLYNINRLIFITELWCFFCAVRTGYLNKRNHVSFMTGEHLRMRSCIRICLFFSNTTAKWEWLIFCSRYI